MDVADILSDLDDHGFEDTEEERKLAILNETYWDICGLEPWPFLEKTVTLTFTGSSSVPVNLTAVATLTDLHAVISMNRDGTSFGRLDHMDYDEWLSRFASQSTTAGVARYFYFIGSALHVYPIPGAADTVTLFYIMTPPELTAATTEASIVIPPQYHRGLLVNGSLVKLYAMEDDLDIGAGFNQFYDRTLATMRDFIWRRQYATAAIVVPADYDDMDVD